MGFISLLVLKLLWMEWIYKNEKKKIMKNFNLLYNINFWLMKYNI